MYFCSRLSETPNMAVVAQLVRVPDCGSVGRRFESDLPPESKAATRDCRCFAFIVLRQAKQAIYKCTKTYMSGFPPLWQMR